MKKAVGSGVGSFSQRYGSGDLDPAPKYHESPTLLGIVHIIPLHPHKNEQFGKINLRLQHGISGISNFFSKILSRSKF
jgi:hypothetical protein